MEPTNTSASGWSDAVETQQGSFRGRGGAEGDPRVWDLSASPSDCARLGEAAAHRAAADLASGPIRTELLEAVAWQDPKRLFCMEQAAEPFAASEYVGVRWPKPPVSPDAEQAALHAAARTAALRQWRDRERRRRLVCSDPLLRLYIRVRSLETPRRRVDGRTQHTGMTVSSAGSPPEGVLAVMERKEMRNMSIANTKLQMDPLLRLHTARRYSHASFLDGSFSPGSCGFGVWLGCGPRGPRALGEALRSATNQDAEALALLTAKCRTCVTHCVTHVCVRNGVRVRHCYKFIVLAQMTANPI